MEELVSLISNVGFPIFVALYFLIRLENKLDRLTAAFIDLTEELSEIAKKQGQ